MGVGGGALEPSVWGFAASRSSSSPSSTSSSSHESATGSLTFLAASVFLELSIESLESEDATSNFWLEEGIMARAGRVFMYVYVEGGELRARMRDVRNETERGR